MAAAESLVSRMQTWLKKTTDKHRLSVDETLSNGNELDNEQGLLSVPPAKSFYQSAKRLFTEPVSIADLENKERTFIARYYDLRLRMLIGKIAKAGQALAIADPGFKGTYNYILVLPLLHTSDKEPIDIKVLPQWMQRPRQLAVLSDSCLLHYHLPFHASMLAEQSARMRDKTFTKLEFYESAAKKCWDSHPHLAAECLKKAIACVPDSDPNTHLALRFELVQMWMDSRDYSLAAAQARKIFEAYPNHKKTCKAIWLYFYALLRSGNAEQILANIDNIISNKQCRTYRPNLMITKWWALRGNNAASAQTVSLEHKLLKQYGSNPVVAPVLLSRATDRMASSDYKGAFKLLKQLAQKFPSTRAAATAIKMLKKMKTKNGTY